MKILRVTVTKNEIGNDQEEFDKRLQEHFKAAGFDSTSTVIRQTRTDIDGVDFIQFRYTWWDIIAGRAHYYYWDMKNWLRRQLTDTEVLNLEERRAQYPPCKCKSPWNEILIHTKGGCYFPDRKPKQHK